MYDIETRALIARERSELLRAQAGRFADSPRRSKPSSGSVSQGATERTYPCEDGRWWKGVSRALSRTLASSDSGQPPPKRLEPQTEQKDLALPSSG